MPAGESRYGPGEIRWGMDVYTFDGHYLGNVLLIRTLPAAESTIHRPSTLAATGSFSGELLGPMPTVGLGNPGPARQSRQLHYGTNRSEAASYQSGHLLVGRYFGLVERRWISLDDIQTVAMERIVLHRRKREL